MSRFIHATIDGARYGIDADGRVSASDADGRPDAMRIGRVDKLDIMPRATWRAVHLSGETSEHETRADAIRALVDIERRSWHDYHETREQTMTTSNPNGSDILPPECVYCGANPCTGAAPECGAGSTDDPYLERIADARSAAAEPSDFDDERAACAPVSSSSDAPTLYGVVHVSDGGAWRTPALYGPFTSDDAAREFIRAEMPDMEPEYDDEPAPMSYDAAPFDTAMIVAMTPPRA